MLGIIYIPRIPAISDSMKVTAFSGYSLIDRRLSLQLNFGRGLYG